MGSKAYQTFKTKIAYFDDDIELIDVLRTSLIEGDLSSENSPHILDRVDPQIHGHLARRQNTLGSRTLMANHLRASLYTSYVKDIYEEVTIYLRTSLERVSKNGIDSGRLIGEHSFKTDAKTLLDLGNWDKVCEHVTSSVFQSLESERSTLQLLRKVSMKLAIPIDQNLIDAAIPYLEARHLFVHADGKANDAYRASYPNIRIRNGKIVLHREFITRMRDSVCELITNYDTAIINADLLSENDIQPAR